MRPLSRPMTRAQFLDEDDDDDMEEDDDDSDLDIPPFLRNKRGF